MTSKEYQSKACLTGSLLSAAETSFPERICKGNQSKMWNNWFSKANYNVCCEFKPV